MCEDSDEETSELDIQSRTWRKLENNMKLIGFREGAAKGKDLSLQEGFNLGYSDGFKLGEYIGMCKGILRCESEVGLSDDKKSNYDEDSLECIRNEACVLCSLERRTDTSPTTTVLPESIEDLISAQQSHNNKVLKTLENLHRKHLDKQ